MNRNLALVAASMFTWGAGEGLFIYFQTLYLQDWGADPLMIGTILGGMGIAMAIFQLPAGYLADKIGQRPIMWASWLLGTASAWLMALANSLPMFVAGVLVYGLTSFVLAPMNSYITAMRGKWSPGRALTFVSAAYHLGAILGPTIGGTLANQYGLKTVYIIASIVLVFSTAIILFIGKPPKEIHPEKEADARLYRNGRFVTLAALTFITVFALYLPQSLTPNFLQNERHLSLQQIGLIGTAGSLGNAMILLILGSLSAPAAFLIGQPLVGLFALLMWQGTSLPLFALGYFFMSGYRLCRSMVMALARSLIHPSETGLAYGMLETANAVAVIVAPLLAGVLYQRSPSLVYRVSMVVIGLAFVLNIGIVPALVRKSETVSLQEEIS
ncbi:arabinose efflux permease [Longilinea arvoryzae]|uniref:Arabinose efflux permease n=1 Tax=Longilinea arvoryzae TaxID=360412 RepID=A0A0S7BLM4_9CHLR|nr:MFS transporter [Longilinea arvoryzae]GAP15224.1 arabinose efflux permease [Longilinea arvoryzae]